jgi:phage protein D
MSTYEVTFDGAPASDDFYDALTSLEVEENAELPDAMKLSLPVATVANDLTWVNDARVKPYANVTVSATPADGARQCIFDGYVLSHAIHLQAGITASKVDVWGQDASVLMGLEEKVREWSGMTDGAVANEVFGQYGFTAAAVNTSDDGPAHTEDGHTLMQRGSDAEFLRRLASRSGRWFRVTCAGVAGARTGFFAVPDLSAPPVATLKLNDPAASNVSTLDFHWDVARPTTVRASQASLADGDPVEVHSTDSGLALLDARGLAAFAGRATTVILTTAADAAELPRRAAGLLRDAGAFARCEGTADVAKLRAVLRVGTIVELEDVGTLLSGRYLVRSVRHTITRERHAMAFSLVRNAVGPAGAS